MYNSPIDVDRDSTCCNFNQRTLHRDYYSKHSLSAGKVKSVIRIFKRIRENFPSPRLKIGENSEAKDKGVKSKRNARGVRIEGLGVEER